MKKFILSVAMILLTAGMASAAPQGRTLRIVLSRRSNVDPVMIVKNLNEKCPNVTLTTNEKESDFMLTAAWAGNYRFMVIAHGGAMVYATQTSFMSNAVKDVCKYLNSQAEVGTPASY
jgi:hypothetical protein